MTKHRKANYVRLTIIVTGDAIKITVQRYIAGKIRGLYRMLFSRRIWRKIVLSKGSRAWLYNYKIRFGHDGRDDKQQKTRSAAGNSISC